MNARRLIFENHGEPSKSLSLINFQTAALKDGEVLLEIHAAPINPADLNYIEGTYGIKPELPSTVGMECSATVLESSSATLSSGDLVFPISQIGGWATHTVTSAENLIKLPSEIDHLQAAMLKVNPATAWLLLNHFEKLQKGDWVTLNASNSGVGQCVIQLAAAMGVKTACFLRNETLAPELTALGAELVLPDTAGGYEAAKLAIGKTKAKLAFNAVGGDSALRLMKLLAHSGTHITYGAMGRKPLTVPNGPLIFGDLRIRGLWVTEWIKHATRPEIEETYGHLARLILDGSLRQQVDSVHSLENFTTALGRLVASDRNGKVLFAKKS
ncbi:MAG: 2-enoyl thioester reductase domain-containing protein [Akkermansiaceae bacterium]|jgi:mitochondrial enoyl-[acyl-carrier protein] reductase / trans-2-enoyl-CoA reductase|nr:2-enoyl thioester reductase domain-containing protein [Akkermansiaceae bacterium]MDP4647782.1 2-enoyl thioester reductase domain-containing protein [Akkermansiaceae bacterium]MDP4719610.1 2-enoyl thioester reductase domain-containing protein [Akkermansiaceae bacterium]MDP4780857.1 2-enoyl thioester reductase domain-containing protein [Akkermansiaceae bacterium]MDP4848431.1 2-enoyl thioester reductase domain-containing protein [Akkermansiaceae bacterium]